MLKPLTRVLIAVLVLLAALWCGLFLWITQPLAGGGKVVASSTRADPARLRATVDSLASRPLRDASHPEILRGVAEDLARELRSFGLPVSLQAYTGHGKEYVNVIASIGPREGDALVIGAHYDIYGDSGPNPGADDNASGVAGLVEVGRLLATSPPAQRVELVAYSTEEPPFFATPQMGSAVHARAFEEAEPKPALMISLEMIGYYSEHQPRSSALLALFYPPRGDFVAVVGRHADRSGVAWLKRGMSATGTIPVRSYAGPWMEELGASDHRNYWALGIPAVMVTDTAFLRNPNYHTEGDRPETLDYWKMAAVVDGLANALRSPIPVD